MTLNNDTQLFRRIGKKKQKKLYFTRELDGVLAAVADDRQESTLVERAVWTYLVDKYGEDEIHEAIEQIQTGLDDDEKLREPKQYTLPA